MAKGTLLFYGQLKSVTSYLLMNINELNAFAVSREMILLVDFIVSFYIVRKPQGKSVTSSSHEY